MTERALYPLFSHYIRDYWKKGSAVFELKICKTGRLPLKALEDHQLRALKMTSSKSGIYHKISDQSQGTKPFDCFFLSEVPSYIVVCFYKTGDYPTYFITPERWETFFSGDKKSITEDECLGISKFSVNLKPDRTKKA